MTFFDGLSHFLCRNITAVFSAIEFFFRGPIFLCFPDLHFLAILINKDTNSLAINSFFVPIFPFFIDIRKRQRRLLRNFG